GACGRSHRQAAFGCRFDDVVGDVVGQYGAECRHTGRTAEGAEERHDGGAGADVPHADRVLRDQDEVLHEHAGAGTHQGQVGAHLHEVDGGGGRVEAAEGD